MTASRTSLVEHISSQETAVHCIPVGDARLPVYYSVGAELKTCTTKSDTVGASAIIYAYSDAILLEALEPHVSILPPRWTSLSSNANKHEGVRVRQSTPQAQILVQLRPGDQFMISSRRFSLTISEPDPVPFTPSVSEHSAVVDLEDEVDSTKPDLLQQGDGNVDTASASASCIASNKAELEQTSSLIELEAAQVPHKAVSPGIRPWPEGNQSDVGTVPIAASSPRLAKSRSETSPTPSETEVTHSRTLLGSPISEDEKPLGDNADTPSGPTQTRAEPTPEAQEGQQNLNEQPPRIAQCPSDFQASEYHPAHPVDGSTTPSRLSRQICNTNSVADSEVERTFREDGPAQPPNVLPQAESVDTQTSTITRADELLHLAGVDSDLSNNGSSPGKVTIATDIEAQTKKKDGFESGTDLARIRDGGAESGDEVDSPAPTSLPAPGRPNAIQPYNLKSTLKRKLESSEKDASLQLETPTKKSKTLDPESSMESTIEVRPRSSIRKVMTSSQTSKRESQQVPAPSVEPDLSSPSQGTVQSQGTGPKTHNGLPPRVLFSNSTVDERAHLMAFLNRQGGRQVKAVKDCTILCVGPGELKKTSKLLLAVVSGKDIVRDKWLVDSARQHRLLDPRPYAAEDSDREAEWGTKLGDAIARGRVGTKPFVDRTIYFTPTLRKEMGSGFLELKEIAILAGAAAVHARLPPKGAGSQPKSLVVASSHDRDAPTLAEAGWTCYSKDVISLSVLQGRLNTESFRLDCQPSAAAPDSDRRGSKNE